MTSPPIVTEGIVDQPAPDRGPSAGSSFRYPGSPPFRDSDLDRRLFKGRAVEASTVLHSILSSSLLVLYARSGMGKTSLLNAGVMEELRTRGYWPVSARLNQADRDPVAQIHEQIMHANADDPEVDVELAPGCIEPVDASLWDLLASFEVWRGNELQEFVLVLDQFEELFTLGFPDQVRERFIADLGSVVRGRRSVEADTPPGTTTSTATSRRPKVRFVIVIREDSLGELEAMSHQIPQILHNRFRLGPLDLVQAKSAICEPAGEPDGRLGSEAFEYTDEAATAILDFLRGVDPERSPTTDRSVVEGGPSTGGGAIDPSQLQIVCQYVEREILPTKRKGSKGEPKRIDASDLGGAAGMEQILGAFYRRTVDSFSEADRRSVRKLCEPPGLINSRGRRISLEQDEIAERFGVSPELLGSLVDQRLLRAERRLDSTYYELAHDTLVEPILTDRASRTAERVRRRRRIALVVGVIVIGLALVALATQLRTSGGNTERISLTLEQPQQSSTIDDRGDQVVFTVPAGEAPLLITVQPTEGAASGDESQVDGSIGDSQLLDASIALTTDSGVRRLQNQLAGGGVERIVVPPRTAAPADGSSVDDAGSTSSQAVVVENVEVTVSSDDGSIGSFDIELAEIDVDLLESGVRSDGEIGPAGSIAVYSASVDGDGTWEVQVEPETALVRPPSDREQRGADQGGAPKRESLDVVVEVIDPSGVGRSVDAVGPGSTEVVNVIETGTSLIVVRGYEDSIGEFTVSANRLDREGLATGAILSGEVSGSAPVEFEVDAATPGMVVVVEPDLDFDAVVDVVGVDGRTRRVDFGGPGSVEIATLTQSGTHLIRVTGFQGSTGSFTIWTAESQELAAGDSVSADGAAVFEVDVGRDDLVEVVATPASDGATVGLQVLGPDGFPTGLSGYGGAVGSEPGASVSDFISGGFGDGGSRVIVSVDPPESGFDVTLTGVDAVPLAVGDSVSADGTAVFEVDVGRDDLVEVVATPASDGATVELQVLGPDGFPTGLLGNGGPVVSEPGASVSDVVTEGFGDGGSRVIVSVDPPESGVDVTLTGVDAVPLAAGDSVSADGTTVFDVELGRDDLVEVVATPASDGATVELRVLGPDGFPTGLSAFGGPVDFDPGASVSDFVGSGLGGTYQVIVVVDEPGAGYQVEANAAEANALLDGDAVASATPAVFEVDAGSEELWEFAATLDPGDESAVLDVSVLGPDGYPTGFSDFQPQPLGGLPDEFAELFSPEVRALFAEGLPPTVDEAVAELSEAGLLEEVDAVIGANPEVAEALFEGSSAVAGEPVSVLVGGDVPGTYTVVVTSSAPTTITGSLRAVEQALVSSGAAETLTTPAAFELDLSVGDDLVFAATPGSPTATLDVAVMFGGGYLPNDSSVGRSPTPGAAAAVPVIAADFGYGGDAVDYGERVIAVVRSDEPRTTVTGSLGPPR